MKKISFIIFIVLIIFPSLLKAQSLEEDRRIEEKKREDLQASEVSISEEIKPPKPIDTIDLIYFAELMPRRVTYGYDLCKVLVILMEVEDEYIDLDSQVAFIKKKKLLPKKLESEFNPMEPLRKGLTAYIFSRALEIRGGIFLTFFRSSQRYALQELVFQGIMSSGNTNDIVSGDELVFILTQAANYKAEKKAQSAKSEGIE